MDNLDIVSLEELHSQHSQLLPNRETLQTANGGTGAFSGGTFNGGGTTGGGGGGFGGFGGGGGGGGTVTGGEDKA